MKILITGAGGPSAISVWKSLHSDHQLFMADMDPCATGLYLVPAAQRLIVPRGDDPFFSQRLLALCLHHRIDLVIATVDAELVPLALKSQEFQAQGIQVPLSPLKALALCADKLALLEAAQAVVPVPQFEPFVDTSGLLHSAAAPLFIKPRRGAGGRGAQIVRGPQDLAAIPRDGSYLLQEWLPGNEYSVDVYLRADGVAIAAVPRLRMKIDSGIAMAARTQHLPALSQAAIDVAQAMGVRFAANVQFREDADGVPKLLEINPRFPGTLPLTQAAGLDLPALLVAEMQGQAMPDGLQPFKEVMTVRYLVEQLVEIKEWQALNKA
ncbi:ATP-grasp domain-containing protein [Comamonas sp. JUb58]|uniref:ATP-grasp domain-containing protein n=1 Tax=Comamonas sp. JUb58 TaxID=2485114 RepID=UPI00106138A8|nr:ATP-grasp domain-containing protein [Comamonas sp. JUb58]